MTATHVPVLLHETVDLLAPPRGGVAVDCTFGAGGHARAIAERLGPDGLLVAIDRDPDAEARFDDVRGRGRVRDAVRARVLRRGPRDARRRGRCGPTPCSWTSACPPCRSTRASAASPTPTTRRSTCGWTRRSSSPRARSSTSGTSASSPARCASWGRSATPARSPAAIVRARARGADRDDDGARRRRLRRRPRARRASPPAIRPSARSRRSGSPSTTSSDSSTRRCPLAWRVLGIDGRFAGISFHSLEDRRVKRFLVDLARGVHLPARPPGVRVRRRAACRAAQPPVHRRRIGRGRRELAGRLRAAARRPQAEGHGMTVGRASVARVRVFTEGPG